MILQYLKTSLLLLLSVQQAYAGNTIECTGGICQTALESVDFSSYIVPEYILAGTHPGLYMGSTGIEDEDEYRKLRINESSKLYHAIYLRLLGDQYALSLLAKLSKSYEIDQNSGEGKPQDRTAHDKAWQWALQNILRHTKPLSEYSGIDFLEALNQLNEILIPKESATSKLLNYLSGVTDSGTDGHQLDDPNLQSHIKFFQDEQKRLQKERDAAPTGLYSRLRQSEIVIYLDQQWPGFGKYEQSLQFLKKQRPDEVKPFKGFYRKLRSVARRGTTNSDHALIKTVLSESTKNEKIFIQKYVGLPIEVKNLPKALKKFLRQLPAKIKAEPIAGAAFAHNQIAKLHPYEDANGRTARLLMNCILLQNGYQAVHFYRNKEYTAAVSESIRLDDNTIFETFLRGQLKMQQKGQVEQDDLAEKMKLCIDDCQERFDEEYREYEQLGLSP